jgi:hypothetical protein
MPGRVTSRSVPATNGAPIHSAQETINPAPAIPLPMPQDWAWLAPLIGPVDADFEAAATTQPSAQERSGLDVFE